MKKALEDPTAKPRAVKMLAELSEVTENESAALELFQAAVDQPNSDSQTWKVMEVDECDEQYYLDYLRDHQLFDLYQQVCEEARMKVMLYVCLNEQFPDVRVIGSHYVESLLRNKEYDKGVIYVR